MKACLSVWGVMVLAIPGRQWSSGISRPGWHLEAGPVPFPAVRRKPKMLAVRLVTLCHQRAPQRSRELAEDGGIDGCKMCIPACSRRNLLVSVGLGPFQAPMADVASSHLIGVGSVRHEDRWSRRSGGLAS